MYAVVSSSVQASISNGNSRLQGWWGMNRGSRVAVVFGMVSLLRAVKDTATEEAGAASKYGGA